MSQAVIIRKASMDDIEAMGQLLSELFAIEDDFVIDEEVQKSGLRLLLENADADVYVADDFGRVIGMVSMQKLISTAIGKSVGLIEDLIITKSYRGRGIGSRLVEALIAESVKKGYGRLSLGADHRNSAALTFYCTKGFALSHMGLMYRIS